MQPTAQPTADEFLTAVACRPGVGCTAVGGLSPKGDATVLPFAEHK